MKIIKLFSSLILLLIIFTANAQTSQRGFSFQGYAISNESVALTDEHIDVKFTIYSKSGTGFVYEEEHADLITDYYGVFHAVIGKQLPALFQKLDFTAKGADYWLKVEVKKLSDFVYTRVSDAEMMSVPYARFADNGVPIGTIISFGAGIDKIPEGWLLCDGTQYDGTTPEYEAIYGVLKNTWGGSGTNFNVPELRGYFLRGVDNGRGQDPDAIARTSKLAGGNTGDNVGTYQTEGIKTHDHPLTETNHTHGYSDSYAGTVMSDDTSGRSVANTSTSTDNGTTNSSGAGVSIRAVGDNLSRPKNANVLYIIKY